MSVQEFAATAQSDPLREDASDRQLFPRLRRCRRSYRDGLPAKCGSTMPAARSMQPMLPITGRFRSALLYPRTEHDVIETIAVCRQFSAPVLSRAGGTSLAGQCCNTAVVIDWSKYFNRIVELNVTERFARVEPGTICDDVVKAGEAARSYLCARPGDARSLLLRRHAREQFLRRPRADERSCRQQCRVARHFAL